MKTFNFYSKLDFSFHNFRSFIKIITRYCDAFIWMLSSDAKIAQHFSILPMIWERDRNGELLEIIFLFNLENEPFDRVE